MVISQSKSIWALFEDFQLRASMMYFLPDHASVAMSDFFLMAYRLLFLTLILSLGHREEASNMPSVLTSFRLT